MKFKTLLLTVSLLLSATTASADLYLVGANDSNNDPYIYKGYPIPAANVFASLQELLATDVPDGSTIFIAPGTVAGDVTINVEGLSIYGNNRDCLTRNHNRSTDETIVTGRWTVNANDVTINGFKFTGNGQVYNDNATTSNPLYGLKFEYNEVSASTLAKELANGVVRLGAYYTGNAAMVNTAHCRYRDITVANNAFSGDATHAANFVTVNGLYGDTHLSANTFYDGGISISVANSQGNIKIVGNKFDHVGNLDRITAGSEGEFCIRLFYNGYSNSTIFDILNNEFDNCNGQSSVYPLIRFFQGDANNVRVPIVNTHVNLNYNSFRNKSMRPKNDNNGVNYNYVYYANADYCKAVTVDPRFNYFDNSEYVIGMITTPWDTENEIRYFASSTSLMDFATSKGCTMSYFTDAKSNEIKEYNLPKSTRVAQSFDVCEETGDIFFIQIYPQTSVTLNQGTYKFKAEEPLVITRLYKNSSGEMAKSYMYLDRAGHGSNMAVYRMNGVPYIFTGGNASDTKNADDKGNLATKTKSNASCIFPYKGGSYANLTQSTYTAKDGSTQSITRFVNKYKRKWQYPAIDTYNRLFAERSTSNEVVYVGIYDLDEVLTQGSNADAIKVIEIPYNSNRSTSTDANYGTVDNGFQTWPAQGFTIAGDFLYFIEGVAKTHSTAAIKDGAAIPTIMIHVINWRTGQFVYRKPIMRSTILNKAHGEPEGIKVKRDKYGRAHLLVGIQSGASERLANIFDFALDEETGLLYEENYNMHTKYAPSIEPDLTDMSFYVYGNSTMDATDTSTLGFTLNNLRGYPTFDISGPNADRFSVSTTSLSRAPQRRAAGTLVSQEGTFADLATANTYPEEVTVTFSPEGAYNTNHSATLRVSSPGADDQFVNLTGVYHSVLTGVDSVTPDANNSTDDNVYNLHGIRVDADHLTPGIYVRAGKKFIVH